MMKIALSVFLFLFWFSPETLATDLLFTEFGSGNETYWMIEPSGDSIRSEKLIVFLHGHGASNPANYGDWIIHLVEQHYVVLFPKFQTGAFVPDPVPEQQRIEKNIDSAVAYLQKKYGHKPSELHFIGHSLGGLLSANISDKYCSSGKYKVRSLTLAQPGHKYLKMGTLSTYEHLKGIRMVCVSGSNDRTAGATFSKHLISNTPNLSDSLKIHFELDKKMHGYETIGSTHEEPVSPNDAVSSSKTNPVVAGANLIGKTDKADTNCFWKIADVLISDPEDLQIESLGDLGTWNDGTHIGKMKIIR